MKRIFIFCFLAVLLVGSNSFGADVVYNQESNQNEKEESEIKSMIKSFYTEYILRGSGKITPD